MTDPVPVPVGSAAPEIGLPGIDGRALRPLAPSPGRRGPALIVFFKDDCPTCLYALPFVGRIHAALEGAGARVFGVAQDEAGRAAAFAARTGAGFPILVDVPDYEVSRRWGLLTVPSFFLVGEDGIVRRFQEGFSRQAMETFARDLAGALGAPVPEIARYGEPVAESRPG